MITLRGAAVALALLAAFLAWFTRTPKRTASDRGLSQLPPNNIPVLAPADGRVVHADNQSVVAYLSLLDVHAQYAPVAARVESVERLEGGHALANTPQSGHNVGVRTVFASPCGPVTVTQRTGFFVRRIRNYLEPGDTTRPSDPFGMILFGSRVDTDLPPKAVVLVKEGDYLYGGHTVIARVPCQLRAESVFN